MYALILSLIPAIVWMGLISRVLINLRRSARAKSQTQFYHELILINLKNKVDEIRGNTIREEADKAETKAETDQ